jgi:hypothetical protein
MESSTSSRQWWADTPGRAHTKSGKCMSMHGSSSHGSRQPRPPFRRPLPAGSAAPRRAVGPRSAPAAEPPQPAAAPAAPPAPGPAGCGPPRRAVRPPGLHHSSAGSDTTHRSGKAVRARRWAGRHVYGVVK